MQLFYIDCYNNEKTIELDKQTSNHICKVLREKEGDIVYLTNGLGLKLETEIILANSNSCLVQVVNQNIVNKPPYEIHLCIAPTKNISRIEWLVEKAVEIGISEITPIFTEHSERKTINLERIDRIIVSAMQQSIKFHKPKLNKLISFENIIHSTEQEKKYLCTCEEGDKIYLNQDYSANKSVCIFIGPEGDFSPKEVLLARENGFKLITLGENRLRTETAALYAISNIHFINQ